MLLLGIDIGTSSIKVSVVDATTQQSIMSAQYPEVETEVIALHPGWAEQSPDMWWENVKQAILKCHASETYNPLDIAAIGIAYQMHGLVLVDSQQHVLRNSIIWCDSRAVDIGNKAFAAIGEEKCLSHLLNSPGNFTASKLAWVKEHEPQIFKKIDKVLLPGDFIAMKFTGEITTTASALSEGVFWDFKENKISEDITSYYGFGNYLFPSVQPLFSSHGLLKDTVATRLSLKKGIPVSYKAGDQPNNALSLNVFNPGEVAATAGTSGVIYAVSKSLNYDKQSRINSFAHVNYHDKQVRIGNLLCINGVGIFNRWVKNIAGANVSYNSMNEDADRINIGSEGLLALPFGNGAERMLNNKMIGAHFSNMNFNVHTTAHLVRAVQEGIAFSFRYGLDIMKENGMNPQVIRAGRANMFLSDVFTKSFAGATSTTVELYKCDGSIGAAIGAGLGAGFFADEKEAFKQTKLIERVEPADTVLYEELYQRWKAALNRQLTI
jgi:xylulokinase